MKTDGLLQRLPRNARVLLIRLRSMGDCLLLTSPVRALKEKFPDFRISVLVEDRFADCFRGNPDFHDIITVTSKAAAALKLAVRHNHVVLNLHGGPTSLFYSFAAWGNRVGAEQYPHAKLYNGLVPMPAPALHTVEAVMSWFRHLGLEYGGAPPLRYHVPAEAGDKIAQIIRGRDYAVIHPANKMDTKRWDPVRFAVIAKRLESEGLKVALTCGPGEQSTVAAVAQDLKDSLIFLGLPIPELAALIRGARIYVGNDTGPMHLAAAVGTPVVVPWGSSDSRRWSPWRVESRVIQNPFECNPCAGYRCEVADHPLCIESVSVEQVQQAIDEIGERINAHASPSGTLTRRANP